MVYILKLDKPLGNERHSASYYVGWCNEGTLERRLHYHATKRGAAFTRAAVEQGIGWEVVVTIPGATRSDERAIKNQKNTRKFVERWQKRQQKGQ